MQTREALAHNGRASWWASTRPYIELTRPPNLATAAADVLAGAAVASATGAVQLDRAAWLVLAGVLLYAGGVVMNDVLDANLDAVERPERPIPSGRASLAGAAALGAGLLAAGTGAAFTAGATSGWLALAIAALAVAYDAVGKPHAALGPALMGACRGLNLLLGVSVVPAALEGRWWLAAFGVAFIAAVTVVSRGEVHDGDRRGATLGLAWLVATLATLALLPFVPGASWWAWPFVALLAWRTVPAFTQAARDARAASARAAVRAGVLSLVALDAALAAAFAGPIAGLAVLALMLVAARLARALAVT